MRARVVLGADVLAVLAAVIAAAMAVAYVAVIDAQGDSTPLWWVLVALAGGAVLCVIGAPARASYRLPVLLVAAGLLAVLGLLAILSIGLPILLAAGLAALAGAVPPVPRTA